VFEIRVLRRIFRSKKQVTGGWKILHSEELHNFFSSSNIEKRTQNIKKEKPDGKIPTRRHRLR
jgi:hypothetical protein